jgi:hexosaminidase
MSARGALALLGLASCAAQATPPLVPLPLSLTFESTTLSLDGGFVITCAAPCPDPLPAAVARYNELVFSAGGRPAPPSASVALTLLPALAVSVQGGTPLALEVDESYALSVPADGSAARLTAVTQWGALRGLETFSQLVQWSKDYSKGSNGSYAIPFAPVAISDAPRWPWRGLLIDTARHFQPLPTLFAILEGASYAKLNVLHWHVFDDESWPLVSTLYPAFSDEGAYAPDALYSHADVAAVVNFAHDRGILVIPEFDMPGHAASWGRGYPALVCPCPGGETLLNPVPAGPGDVYDTLDGLLREFLPLFGSPPLVHLGGDEVFNTTCWSETPAVNAWAASQGYAPGDMHAVREYFESRIQAIVASHGASSMFWEEVWNGKFSLRQDAVVNTWLNMTDIVSVLQSGRRVVSAYGLYANRAQPQAPLRPVHYAFSDTWQDFYLLDPLAGLNATLTPGQLANFKGETFSQWSIQYSPSNILPSIFPRACAAAERMWSAEGVRGIPDAAARLGAHSCRTSQRGVPSGPLTSSYCPTRGAPGVPPAFYPVHANGF